MDTIQVLLQVSAKLYQHLTYLPAEDERDAYIEKVNQLLEERGNVASRLQTGSFMFDEQNKSHQMLLELDKGIKKRLNNVMNAIKEDLRAIQNSKKNEQQYLNPYANVAVMDGRYYDKKN